MVAFRILTWEFEIIFQLYSVCFADFDILSLRTIAVKFRKVIAMLIGKVICLLILFGSLSIYILKRMFFS